MTDDEQPDELEQAIARFARTGALPSDRDLASGVLKASRAIVKRSADPDDSPARVELREQLRGRVFV